MTAYDVRISDWSSDVCSSDLRERSRGGEEPTAASGGVIDYHAPADAASTALGDGEVDVVFSNSVLEHVPEAAIDTMYREAMRILAPGGIMFHSVNCGDHYAYVDRSEEHTSEFQSLMRISYAVFCLKKKNNTNTHY